MFPMPNATDPSGTRQYNYEWEGIVEKLRTDQVLRVDWNVRDRHDVLQPPAVRS